MRRTCTTQQEPAFIRPFVRFLIGMLLLVGLVILASSHFFPFFPLFWALTVLVLLRPRKAAVWPGSAPVLVKPSLTSTKERELLEALGRRGEITAARAALETSLTVAQADEMLSKLAAELGPQDVRALCPRPAGIPESWEGISTEGWSGLPTEIEAQMKARSLLGRVTTLADVGNAAAFLASDRAGATTGTVFNLTSGTVVD